MKLFALVAGVVIFIVIAIPMVIVGAFETVPESAEPVYEHQETEALVKVSANEANTYLFMYDHLSHDIIEIDIEDYVIGVVAAEMPASFHIEALKAQAVAARTFAVYNMRSEGGDGCRSNLGADVCSSFAHCQAWIDIDRMKEKWGEDFEENFDKIEEAVRETNGQIMLYREQPIEVLFHSTSNGMTEDAGEVFLRSLPYYQVVESRGEERSSRFRDTVTLSYGDFIRTFNLVYPRSGLNANEIESQIRIINHTRGGRVNRLRIGAIELEGTEFRRIFGLNSADFSFRFGNGRVRIDTVGFGHGVGMSQVGANYMAMNGYDHITILKHYYTGVQIDEDWRD